MKNLLSLAALAAALLFAKKEKAAAQANFHALLIGIGDYPADGGWKRINAANDLDLVRRTLEQRGVPPQNIATLVHADATRAGILDAFRYEFLEKLGPGDVAYFQFSGHGQQVADEPGGDEMDGLDEAIVPWDSPMRYEPGVYEGQRLVRDDELSGLFTEARRRLGPRGNLIVVLDACHSGTGTRGMDIARGTDVVMASPEQVAAAGRSRGSGQAYDPFATGNPSGELAPMASFFGSAQHQLNFETRDENGRGIGSLTYALTKKLLTARSDQTYRGLFEEVKIEMAAIAPRQQPQAEGMLDQEIFGGNMREAAHFFHVTRWNDPGSVAIDAGSIFGLNEGSKVGLFPPETRDPQSARPIATGTVVGAQAFEATLQLDRSLDEAEARSAWVYVLEQNFGSLKIGVSIDLSQNGAVRDALMEKLREFPVIDHTSARPEILITERGGTVELWNAQDVLLDEVAASRSPEAAAEAIIKRVLNYVQAKFLRKMDAQSPLVDVSMEIFPVQLDKRTWTERPLPASEKRDGAGNFHAKEGDVLKIRLTNRGSKAAYFTLLDIQPDNKLNVLVPDVGQSPAEFRIGAGETIEVAQRFEISPPSGTEVFKLIATEQPIDLRPIASSRGETGTKANPSPFERLFQDTFGGEPVQSRGGRTLNLAAGSLHVSSSTFIID